MGRAWAPRDSVSAGKERTVPLWLDTYVAPAAAPLDQNIGVDVVVAGSGIAGLSTAFELILRGCSVAVLDRGAIGQGMTARSTAHLTATCDDSFGELIKLRGLDVARLFYRSHSAAIDRIEAVQREQHIDCDFRRLDGILFPALGSDASVLDRELEVAREVGVGAEEGKGLPFQGLCDARYLRYRNQAIVHPLKYLRGLAEAIQARNGRLCAETPVEAIEENEKGATVRTGSGRTVRANAVVVATNSPINDRLTIHVKQAPSRTYVMAFTIPHGVVDDAMYWDTEDPYHYVRLQRGPGNLDYLIVGGADHRTGEADDAADRIAAIEAWTRSLIPQLGPETHRWSGQIMEPIDYTAFIGRNPGNERVYVATGGSGHGMTHAVVASLLLSDLIVDGESPWEEVYDPARKTPGATKTFVAQSVTTLKSYVERMTPGEIDSVDQLEPGQGAIVREGLAKVAAFRDESGELHKLSAVCTHAGCILRWNSLERCWDCPCHGSHFDVDGAVLNGPAIAPLPAVASS
jgi:glycine/D-amino acid oxidase-like deaminating enzyme/nitrite reductase/ring-hydroxylating ferredoxin subunit